MFVFKPLLLIAREILESHAVVFRDAPSKGMYTWASTQQVSISLIIFSIPQKGHDGFPSEWVLVEPFLAGDFQGEVTRPWAETGKVSLTLH